MNCPIASELCDLLTHIGLAGVPLPTKNMKYLRTLNRYTTTETRVAYDNSTYLPTNQPTNQAINQAKQPTNELTNQPSNPLANQPSSKQALLHVTTIHDYIRYSAVCLGHIDIWIQFLSLKRKWGNGCWGMFMTPTAKLGDFFCFRDTAVC